MARTPLDPAVARAAWRRAEPIHAMIYFAPEARQRYDALGLDGLTGYFASRAAAFGAVPAEPVIATFFNFKPALVRAALPAAWERVEPPAVLRARLDAADAALSRAFSALEGAAAAVAEAAELARRAAESACEQLPGRPLFAAHAALPWPDEPHLVLWHAQTLLREFRGDGHVNALVVAGVDGLDALVLHAATGDVPVRFLLRSRGWTGDEWAAAVDGLRSRGLLADGDADDLTLTEAGRELRQSVEDRTDALAEPAYRVLGEDGCARLAEAARPLSRAVVDAGLLNLKATPTAG
ncbi:SCO6745 family protein [Micromonospora purpureochromogenes]|uniref:SalK n=1 Tax=Micromonospora purpureochromogenes TaxID=47872 RepID=A0ABX2RPJ9_9ACTN|nr:hypothetical protein [Micromonospora purpureochromogenes]NYF57144.1 hypothetical protein [Micromonospora purpureochromogenes]